MTGFHYRHTRIFLEKHFNTAGPNNPDWHYTLDPLKRWDMDAVLTLIRQNKYFVLHAPRQTGKTSCLLALSDYLNNTNNYVALYANIESAQAAREDKFAGIRAVMGNISSNVKSHLNSNLLYDKWNHILQNFGPEQALTELLKYWAQHEPKPIVLLLDEVDALIGDTLISLLRQIRAGYASRPAHFPASVILCGVRDVRDYRIHSANSGEIITGGSAFNIKAESLRLGDFTHEDIRNLYAQHTQTTGQTFDDECWELVYEYTGGQPWLVNALAYEACFRMKEGKDRSMPITTSILEQAKENLILRRDTHLDQLVDKLQEERVKRVIQPILQTEGDIENLKTDDILYCIDLGLVKRTDEKTLAIKNAIYQEIIPRELTFDTQAFIHQPQSWYVLPNGRLDMHKLLAAFQQFFREHSESWLQRFQYHEAGPQLLMQAFLQRIVNGGGRIDREYGLGRGRTDLYVQWHHASGTQREVIELKVLRYSLEKTIETGMQQTAAYMDKCGADTGHLLIFDRRPGISWEEKIFHHSKSFQGRTMEVWGC